MGNCTKKPRSPVKFYQLTMPEFIYFDKRTQFFYKIQQKGATKIASYPYPINSEIFTNYLPNSYYLITSYSNSNASIPSNYHLSIPSISLNAIKPLPAKIQILETVNSNTQLLVISKIPFNIFTYNANNDNWTELAPLMTNISNSTQFSSCIYKNKLIILCLVYSDNTFSDDVYSVALETNSRLKTIKKYTSPKLLGAKVHVKGNQIFVAGGLNASGEANSKFYFSQDFRVWEWVECGIDKPFDDCFFFDSGKSVCFVCFPMVFVIKNKALIQFVAPDLELRHDFLSTADNIPSKHFSKESSINKSALEKDFSQISASFILQARVLTPINQTLRETITSYDSDLDSQRLYSLEDAQNSLEISIGSKKNLQGKSPDLKSTINVSKLLKTLSRKHNAEFFLDPNKASELLIFISDILNTKPFSISHQQLTRYSLLDLEQHLKSLNYKLFPINIFNLIIQALEILLPLPHKPTKDEKKAIKNSAGLKKSTQLLKKDDFVNGIIFRIKLSFT